MEQVERLEQKIAHLEEKRLESIEGEIRILSGKVDELILAKAETDRQLERYSARWGLLLMVGSAIVAGIKLFWGDFLRLIK